jgi:DNA processing protein
LVDRVYPPEHCSLAAEIASSGAVLSELPPGRPPFKLNFPARNRIISGMSLGVVVVEASDRSGSLITAGCALEQNREVMVVPGNPLSGRSRGGHNLVKDGAALVETAADVLQVIGLRPPPPAVQEPLRLGEAEAALLALMDPGERYDVDSLAALSHLDATRLLPLLLSLELAGQVRRLDGGGLVRSRPNVLT